MGKQRREPPSNKKRKNNKQLRLSRQNEVLSERLMLQYQLDCGTTCDWTWFGNHLLQLGMVSLKKTITSSMSHRDRMLGVADEIKKGL